MIFLDTETCGLHGPIVLLQWAEDNGEVELHEVWNEPVKDTLSLIERIVNNDICGFNLVFDWFHICQLYTVFLLLEDKEEPPNITEYARKEATGRDGPCLRPLRACDLMLYARKGPYQSTMDRKDIIIRKVPALIVDDLVKELEERIKIRDIYFARSKHGPRWTVRDTDDPDFKNIVLKFKASSALKALAADAFGEATIAYEDIQPPSSGLIERGYAPFGGNWPKYIGQHISHWSNNALARRYATLDVVYLQKLYKFFDNPEPGDVDSELAVLLAATRWKGFAVDVDKIKENRELAVKRVRATPTAPNAAKVFITEGMNELEKHNVKDTRKITLETLINWKGHPASKKAALVLDARKAIKEIELYDKLLEAGRLHASFKIIGTLSSRMSGADDLNAQGIPKKKNVRQCFILKFEDEVLCGGDFENYEVVLADAAYGDPKLRKDLLEERDCICENGCKDCNGTKRVKTKIHGIFGTFLFPGKTYNDILKSSGTEDDKYRIAKSGVFLLLYGGTPEGMEYRLGIPLQIANDGYERFTNNYVELGKSRRKIIDMFCSMRQPGGIGTKVEWHEPAEYIESLMGFRRYFTLENQICKALFQLANNPPDKWRTLKLKVKRREREQTVGGAAQSALYGCAFAIQSKSMKAACNHVIQSSGATITKQLQYNICSLQPKGIHDWHVRTFNIHDELMVATKPEYVDKIREIVTNTVNGLREKVPLLSIDWNDRMRNWNEKL